MVQQTQNTHARPPRRISKRRVLITIVLLVIALGAAAVVIITEAIRRAPIPLGTPSGEIAFISNRDGSWDIFSLNPQGTLANLTTIADGPTANDYFASWSMDSQRINFLSDRTSQLSPTQIETDGSSPRSLDIVRAIMIVVAEGRLDWDPAWSPDGQQIAWSSLRDLNLELYRIDTASEFTSQNAQRLTQDAARDWFPAWSPDGKNLAFASDRDGDHDEIYLLDVETGAVTRLTSGSATAIFPMWSLDGRQIAFAGERDHVFESGILDLYVMNADGSDQRPLTANIRFDGDPTWSPDGSQVAFISNREGPWHIYVMDASGDNVRRLTDGHFDHLFPVWRP